MAIYVIIFSLLLLFAFGGISTRRNEKLRVLYFLCLGFVLFIGFRGSCGADSLNYIAFFSERTDSLWDWQGVQKGYAEYGFYYLSVFLKSIYNSVTFYFIAISALTMTFLLKSLKHWCVFPLLGLCVYYSRFLLFRDMNQIRAALAIAIIIYALRFLVVQKRSKYIAWVLLAVTLHLSSVIALFFVCLYRVRLSFKKVIWILAFSVVGGYVGGMVLKQILITTNNIVLLTYVNTQDLGLLNPVIFYQAGLCLSFFYFERLLRRKQPGYYVIRNAYLYSTVILLLTSNLGSVGGRLASLFATCEIFIVPALVYVVRPRLAGYGIMVTVISLIFYMNYMKMCEFAGVWMYHTGF